MTVYQIKLYDFFFFFYFNKNTNIYRILRA